MKRTLLNAAAAALFLCTGTLTANAQTAYGLANNSWWTDNYYSGLSIGSVDVSALNADAATEVTLEEAKLINYDILAGTSVGNKYYAVMEYYDEEGTQNSTVDFYSVNFTSGEITKISSSCYGNDAGIRNAGYTMNGLAYDDATSTLYGIEYTYDDDAATNVTNLYTVNTSNGALTKKATFSDQYISIAYIGGKIYLAKVVGSGWWNLGLSLYEVTDGTVAADAAFSVESIKGLNSSSKVSFATASNGTTYMQLNSTIVALDFTEQTATVLGSTSKQLQGLTFTKSSENGTSASGDDEDDEATTRFLVRTTRYGDSMGNVSNTQDMSKTEYFYDADNKLLRIVESARGYNEDQSAGDYGVTYYTKYLYNENGQLDSTARYQTGLYEFGDWVYNLRSTTSGYEYDEQGRLITEPTSSYTYKYEYDEKNNIVKSTKVSLAGKTIQVLEYSDFVGKNKPQAIVSTCPDHPDWTSYIYNATRTYDANKNILSEVRSRNDQAYWQEAYTYDGKFLTEKVESYISNGEATPSQKTVYKMVDDDPNKIWYSDSTYYDGHWTGNGNPHMDEYVDFAEMGELVAIRDLSATLSSEGINNVDLKFTAPAIALTGCNFDIYRRGEKIATKGVMDLYKGVDDELTGMPILNYTDSALVNNTYEYFVQPVVSAFVDELADDGLDDDMGVGGGDDVASASTGYNISNLAEITLALNLPAVTDLKQGEPYADADDIANVEISWTNPTYPEEYGFISNDLMFTKDQLADNTTTDPTATSLNCVNSGRSNQVFILSRYKYGKAISDTLTVDFTVDGIGTVKTANGEVSLNGRELTLGGNANVAIYGMSGKMEASMTNASSMSLNALKPGAYIVCVTREGKTTAVKVVLK